MSNTAYGQVEVPTKDEVYDYLIGTSIEHRDIVYKQILLETGHLKSYLCRVQHNLFAMKVPAQRRTLAIGEGDGNDYAVFRTWKESVDDYEIWQNKYYHGEEDYYQFLIDANYAESTEYISKLQQITK